MTRTNTRDAIENELGVVAPNYSPLPVVIASGDGAWVTDVDGRRYLDALAGYSAVNFGHGNPRLLAAARKQLGRLTMTSRAFHNDQLGPFCSGLADLTGQEMVLPMNTGAEAVETAIKAARKWGYNAKGVTPENAQIIVMSAAFHGRTTTIVSFSDDPDAHDDFGPFTPGFTIVPFGEIDAVREAITNDTVAVLVELIQGEAGVVIPDPSFPSQLRELCTGEDVLMIVDEVQSGFGRTGHTFASELFHVKPDLLILGKALGGGIMPVSAVAGRADVLGHLTPGTHGSTFGGNPLAAAIGIEVIQMMREGTYQRAASERGEQLGQILGLLQQRYPEAIEGFTREGLWAGIQFSPEFASGREICEAMMDRQVLLKDAHGSVVRLSPPLTVSRDDIDFLGEALEDSIRGIYESSGNQYFAAQPSGKQ